MHVLYCLLPKSILPINSILSQNSSVKSKNVTSCAKMQGVENAGRTKYGKPTNTRRTALTDNGTAYRSFCSLVFGKSVSYLHLGGTHPTKTNRFSSSVSLQPGRNETNTQKRWLDRRRLLAQQSQQLPRSRELVEIPELIGALFPELPCIYNAFVCLVISAYTTTTGNAYSAYDTKMVNIW